MSTTVTADSVKLSITTNVLSHEELRKMNAYWRAANYLSVGQIYLYANPRLREPLKNENCDNTIPILWANSWPFGPALTIKQSG